MYYPSADEIEIADDFLLEGELQVSDQSQISNTQRSTNGGDLTSSAKRESKSMGLQWTKSDNTALENKNTHSLSIFETEGWLQPWGQRGMSITETKTYFEGFLAAVLDLDLGGIFQQKRI